MADDFPEYEPHTLTDDRRKAYREAVKLARMESQWANILEETLDDADYWRSRASKPTADDSELQGELDVLREASDQRYWHSQHLHLARMCNAAHGHIDAINRGEFAGPTLDVKCQQLADALTDERAETARLTAFIRRCHEHLEQFHYRPHDGLHDRCVAVGEQLTAERAKVATLSNEIGDISRALLLSPCPSCDKLEDGVKWLSDELRAERANVAELQHQLETANAANARRAEESQLEPVGWLCRDSTSSKDAFIHYCEGVPQIEDGDYSLAGHGFAYVADISDKVQPLHHRRVYLGPAEPLEVTP